VTTSQQAGIAAPSDLAPLCVDGAGLAVLLNVSPKSIRRLNDSGKLPASIKLGRLRRWFRPEVEEWLRAGAPPRREWAALWKTRQNLRSQLAAPREVEA